MQIMNAIIESVKLTYMQVVRSSDRALTCVRRRRIGQWSELWACPSTRS